MPGYGHGWKVTAKISNAFHPEFFFECEMMIDTGCKVGDIALPLRKVQQLRLEKIKKTRIAITGSAKELVQFYSPVGCELRATDGTILYSNLEPFVTPRGARLHTGIPEDLSAETHDPSAPVVPISPVKLPIPEDRDDLETPLLGAPGLGKLGLGIDQKNNLLFAVLEDLL